MKFIWRDKLLQVFALLLVLLMGGIVSHCSIQKRLYRKGFYVERFNSKVHFNDKKNVSDKDFSSSKKQQITCLSVNLSDENIIHDYFSNGNNNKIITSLQSESNHKITASKKIQQNFYTPTYKRYLEKSTNKNITHTNTKKQIKTKSFNTILYLTLLTLLTHLLLPIHNFWERFGWLVILLLLISLILILFFPSILYVLFALGSLLLILVAIAYFSFHGITKPSQQTAPQDKTMETINSTESYATTNSNSDKKNNYWLKYWFRLFISILITLSMILFYNLFFIHGIFILKSGFLPFFYGILYLIQFFSFFGFKKQIKQNNERDIKTIKIIKNIQLILLILSTLLYLVPLMTMIIILNARYWGL